MQTEDDKLNEKIKSSFGQMNKKAPELFWESLSASLDAIPEFPLPDSAADRRIYQKIKQSFAARHKEAPVQAWQAINIQLNIDRVWTRIKKDLDEASGMRWQRWAAVLLLVLLSAGAALYFSRQKLLPSGSVISSLASPPQTPSRHPAAVGSSAPAAARVPAGQQAKQARENSGRHGNQPGRESIKETAGTSGQQHRAAAKPGRGALLPAAAPAAREKEKEHRQEMERMASARKMVPAEPGTKPAGGIGSALPGSGEASGELPGAANAVLVNSSGSQQGLSRLEPRGISLAFADKMVPVSQDLAFDTVFAPVVAPVVTAGLQKRVRSNDFDIGAALIYHNSWLLNNETHNSFEKGSLIASDLTFKKNVGLILNYYADSKNLISTEFHLAKNGQQYRLFRDGGYNKQGLELTYYKVYVQYQRQFLAGSKSPLADLTLKAGLYGAVLYHKQGDLRATASRYSNHDYGVRLALGQEKKIGFIILGYGVGVERGLTNIFLGSDQMPGRFDKTYNLNLGPYLNMRYRLQERIRLSR